MCSGGLCNYKGKRHCCNSTKKKRPVSIYVKKVETGLFSICKNHCYPIILYS